MTDTPADLFAPGSLQQATWAYHRAQVRALVERAMNEPELEQAHLADARRHLNAARQLEADAAPVREAAE
jgi:hypothetical protein